MIYYKVITTESRERKKVYHIGFYRSSLIGPDKLYTICGMRDGRQSLQIVRDESLLGDRTECASCRARKGLSGPGRLPSEGRLGMSVPGVSSSLVRH